MKCAVDVAPVRANPDDEAEQVTQALRGEPLTVHERRDGWARVTTAYEYPGWIREEAVEEGDGELPARAAGDPVEPQPGVGEPGGELQVFGPRRQRFHATSGDGRPVSPFELALPHNERQRRIILSAQVSDLVPQRIEPQ